MFTRWSWFSLIFHERPMRTSRRRVAHGSEWKIGKERIGSCVFSSPAFDWSNTSARENVELLIGEKSFFTRDEKSLFSDFIGCVGPIKCLDWKIDVYLTSMFFAHFSRARNLPRAQRVVDLSEWKVAKISEDVLLVVFPTSVVVKNLGVVKNYISLYHWLDRTNQI